MSESEPETREELLQHLEKLTGRTLKTREDIQAYVHEVSARKAADQPGVRRWLKVKRLALLVLLGFAVIQYYMLDVLLEIASMRSTTFFVPVSTPVLKSMLITPAIVVADGDVCDRRCPGLFRRVDAASGEILLQKT